MDRAAKRRAFGQHFLKDERITRLIAETTRNECKKTNCQNVLEIGPGKGAITFPLLELLAGAGVKTLTLCERDRALADKWRMKLAQNQTSGIQLGIEEADFLELPESNWLTANLGVASNLPYSAGTAILTRLAKHTDKIPFMVLMFQAEVAQRLRAEIGTKDWGSLSVWIRNRWTVEKLCTVPPGAFSPPASRELGSSYSSSPPKTRDRTSHRR
jgi:16S rRNA (adenine1518-N6/adenine1519-N6)-dimethyltransferase